MLLEEVEVGGEEDYTGHVPLQCKYLPGNPWSSLPVLPNRVLNVSTVLLMLVNSGTIGVVPSARSPTEVLSAFSSP